MPPPSRRFFPLVLMLGLAGQGLADSMLFDRAVLAQTLSRVSLKLRKEPKHIDVMLAGIGESARVVQERSTRTSWRGTINRSDQELSTKELAQQVAMPEMGLANVRLSGSDSTFQLEVISVAGTALPKPQILATGDDLVLRFPGLTGAVSTRQTGSFDLLRPGRIPQRVSAPPVRPRAVAPPLGDMAVGSILINNRSFVQVSGPPVTLTLNNAPAKDALMSLARLGGYGFVFVADTGVDGGQPTGSGGDSTEYPVTMAFRNERFDRALNSVLMASGLQGRLDGATLLVGTAVSAKSFGPQMSKVFRLNQVDADAASRYLGNLGAIIQIANTSKTTSRESETSGTSSSSSESSTSTTSEASVVNTYGSGVGPLLGLVGTTDSRLNTITLVGEPSLINIAQSYLKQIDLRKRQVAVKVQILNVTLDNDATIDSNFSAKIGDAFIVSQSGKAHMNFGAYKPGGAAGTGVFDGQNGQVPGSYPDSPTAGLQRPMSPVVPLAESAEVVPVKDEDGNLTGYDVIRKPLLVNGQEVYVPDSNPNLAPELVPVYDKYGRPKLVPERELKRYSSDSFYSYIESVVVSANAKTLAQPTLLVQEGEKASVESGESVITGVQKDTQENGVIEYTNDRETMGLKIDVEVQKIDDNGFISMRLDPEVSVPVPAGTQEGVAIYNKIVRKLESGTIRLRDQQTLILTGVIQDSDRQIARKWPVLGDLPLIGQLFRGSSSSRQKNELVIIVTPSILDDDNGGAYGYGYRPGTEEATRLIGSGLNP